MHNLLLSSFRTRLHLWDVSVEQTDLALRFKVVLVEGEEAPLVDLVAIVEALLWKVLMVESS